MNTVYRIRGFLCNAYMRFEMVFKSIAKFGAYLFIFRQIAGWEGFSGGGILNAFSIHMLLALICVLLPARFVGFFAALIIVYNVYTMSFWGAIMMAVLLLVLYIVIARLCPDEAFLLILMPLAMKYNFFMVLPLIAGLHMGIFAVIPMCGGVLLWGILRIIPAFLQFNVTTIDELPKAFAEMAGYFTDQLIKNENLIFLMILCFGVTAVVWLLNKINFKHMRFVALGAGTLIGLLCLLIGRSLAITDLNLVSVVVAPLIAFAVMCVIEFFAMVLNYKMGQRLAFADDDYYYYVSAIPKILGIKRKQTEIKTITNTVALPSQDELEEEPVRREAAAQKRSRKEAQQPAYVPYAPQEFYVPEESAKKTEKAEKLKKEKPKAEKPKAEKPKKEDSKNAPKKPQPVKNNPAPAPVRKLSDSEYDEEPMELTGFGAEPFAFELESADEAEAMGNASAASAAPKKEISQEKIDELRARTGWSDETIKGFLAGMDEEQ